MPNELKGHAHPNPKRCGIPRDALEIEVKDWAEKSQLFTARKRISMTIAILPTNLWS